MKRLRRTSTLIPMPLRRPRDLSAHMNYYRFELEQEGIGSFFYAPSGLVSGATLDTITSREEHKLSPAGRHYHHVNACLVIGNLHPLVILGNYAPSLFFLKRLLSPEDLASVNKKSKKLSTLTFNIEKQLESYLAIRLLALRVEEAYQKFVAARGESASLRVECSRSYTISDYAYVTNALARLTSP